MSKKRISFLNVGHGHGSLLAALESTHNSWPVLEIESEADGPFNGGTTSVKLIAVHGLKPKETVKYSVVYVDGSVGSARYDTEKEASSIKSRWAHQGVCKRTYLGDKLSKLEFIPNEQD